MDSRSTPILQRRAFMAFETFEKGTCILNNYWLPTLCCTGTGHCWHPGACITVIFVSPLILLFFISSFQSHLFVVFPYFLVPATHDASIFPNLPLPWLIHIDSRSRSSASNKTIPTKNNAYIFTLMRISTGSVQELSCYLVLHDNRKYIWISNVPNFQGTNSFTVYEH